MEAPLPAAVPWTSFQLASVVSAERARLFRVVEDGAKAVRWAAQLDSIHHEKKVNSPK